MEPSSQTTRLKEGFLVKKGHVRTNWRTRWFVLFNDALAYYKKKNDEYAAGAVLLAGCSVLSPCPQYTKKTGVFQLSTLDGLELLMQASNEAERDEWAKAIGDAIRTCSSAEGQNGRRSELTEAQVKRSKEIIQAMQDPGAGIKLKTKTLDGTEYKFCFSGQELVDWLLKWSFAETRKDAVAIATDLVIAAHLHPLVRCRTLANCRQALLDEPRAFYKFSAFHMSAIKALLPSSSDSDSSNDSDTEAKSRPVSVSAIKSLKGRGGKPVKQGFMMKRGHVRHTWKARLFVLWDEPPYLMYYRGSKAGDEKPLGEIPLRWCKVDIVDASRDHSDLSLKNKQRQNLFSVTTEKGKMYVMQAGSPEERTEWMRAIMSPNDITHHGSERDGRK
ncbi:pleckstrin-2-like [Acanthaster planci]|uniref:Pleckstrin-2-like n=1 Tax=Acanthaster planci TaxID=133434 RepID=A0A8B7ZFX9_ACAPL|nr:pleckstrin-2-like [Acanthaster planci]XP_022103902.1 pleckstrin-2-like [Acanthaster planci]